MNKAIDGEVSTPLSGWSFDGEVSKIFDTHVVKSIPMYNTFHDLAVKLCDWFITDNCTVMDVGTSTGTFIKNLIDRHSDKRINFLALDTSRDMLVKASEKLRDYPNNIEFVVGDISNEVASTLVSNNVKMKIIVCMFTLQFLKEDKKKEALANIYDLLESGGILIIADKFLDYDESVNQMFDQLYDDFKLESGLTLGNIYSKKVSLRGIQHNDTESEFIDSMETIGFRDVKPFARYLNFVGYFAIKG